MIHPENRNLIIAALCYLEREWARTVGNLGGDTYHNPFCNTSGSWENDTFRVQAYRWTDWTDEDRESVTEETTNFWYRDIRIRWCRDCLGVEDLNREVSNDEIREMLDACLASLDRMDPGDTPIFTGPIPEPATPWVARKYD